MRRKRKKMNMKKSKKYFSKTSRSVKRNNRTPGLKRGGIRL